MNKTLKRGYTTGVHTSWAFKSALGVFLTTQELTITKTIKMDNDDLDVTKGCEIVVSLSNNLDDLDFNIILHKPYLLYFNNTILHIYASSGVGIVTKDGLKPPKYFPAINPKPLEVLELIFQAYIKDKKCKKMQNIYCTVGVTNGEQIAKQTANEKVGVLGGISILGTTGFVKPISATAYIDSIKQELHFIKANSYDSVIFTLGNSSLAYANKFYKEEQIVEIGNFVYDGIKLAKDINIQNIIFICGIGKMTKVAQGFKNTHNRFGAIDFQVLKDDIKKELFVDIDTQTTKTVKGISEQIAQNCKNKEFYNMIESKANLQIKTWFSSKNIKAQILEDIGNIAL